MSYIPPAYNAVDFTWQGAEAYSAPAFDAVDFNFQDNTGQIDCPVQVLVDEIGQIDCAVKVSVGEIGQVDCPTAVNVIDGIGLIACPITVSVIDADMVACAVKVTVGEIDWADCSVEVSVGTLGGATCAVKVLVTGTGTAACLVRVDVLSMLEVAGLRASCATHVNVTAVSAASCPVTVTVSANTGAAACPMRVSVSATGAAICQTLIPVTAFGTKWKPHVLLAGVDVSARLTGVISVEGEEGAARIAEFQLVPEDGAVNPFALSGATVSIDYISIESGSQIAQRLFTGRVDVPEYDANERLIRFTCTDDLQNRVAALDRALIDALIGGRFDIAVQGEQTDNWDYAQARLSTVAGSFDASPSGSLRVTSWSGLATWCEFGPGDVLDDSVTVDLPRRTHIINQVNATFEYRFNRLRQRVTSVQFRADLDQVIDHGLPLLAKQTVLDALDATGWEVLSTDFVPFPESVLLDNYGTYAGVWLNHTGDTTCMEFSARLQQRWAQNITETYSISISAPQSVSHNGVIVREERGALASEWDANAWENTQAEPETANGIKAWGSKKSAAEPKLIGTATLDYAPDATTAQRDAAIQTLIDMGKVVILASHRSGRASATVPILPALDLNRACRINTPTVKATGKVVRLRHTMDMDAGSALTEFSLAISGHGAVGLETATTPTASVAPPAATETRHPAAIWGGMKVGALATSPDYSDDMVMWLVNAPVAFNVVDQGGSSYELNAQTQQETQQNYAGAVGNPEYRQDKAFPTSGLRIILPQVDSDERDTAAPAVSSSFAVEIPADEFLLAA